ncbi:aldo/keto reductase [Shouchella hunanensis]|uniref:Aldo/keto reductase n=1 Tax=Shouchella hunanensis TaxID=766894 RepID=A0ABY7WA14_9BACI|nr:aldo/keto reductase [Shouchella hunanensis]WDF05538.1 aldo/keto reductase [Shouchella hunanensis]
MKSVRIAGRKVFPIGLGTANMGSDKSIYNQELEAIRGGLEAGIQVIDTAESYGNGDAENLVGHAIAPFDRKNLFLVSKVLPSNASKTQIPVSIDRSLKRLNTEYLDMYLLHWKGNIPIEETVLAMEKVKDSGKIKAWGVSNFDAEDIYALRRMDGGINCSTNQVRYNLGDRGIEFDLLPTLNQFDMALMAYSPIARGDQFGANLTKQKKVIELAEKYNVDVFQILLAWSIRDGQTLAIPKSSKIEHVLKNVDAATISLNSDDLRKLDEVSPKPTSKMPLALWY